MHPNNAVILLVEDNKSILLANERILRQQGYDVLLCSTLEQAKEQLQSQHIDLIVLDIMMPDGSGLDFIGVIRSITTAPVLLLTSLASKDHMLASLHAGGDDYISKPYDIDEFTARIQALLRREALRREAQPLLNYGGISLDIASQNAYFNRKNLMLSPKEFSLLYFLLQAHDEILSYTQLYEAVWRSAYTGDVRVIKTAISRLRSKLLHAGCELQIVYIRDMGYALELGE
ncbi:response regulator transcription factor [Eubacteriales bacterium OttesenSCG-928-N14]|nr:response regulator transcription factor [Eubacteriales bacterium OttesenSCG-928-N14]